MHPGTASGFDAQHPQAATRSAQILAYLVIGTNLPALQEPPKQFRLGYCERGQDYFWTHCFTRACHLCCSQSVVLNPAGKSLARQTRNGEEIVCSANSLHSEARTLLKQHCALSLRQACVHACQG